MTRLHRIAHFGLQPATTPPALAGEIHTAAREGDLARVKALIEADPELVDALDERQCRPVHFAAGGGHVAVLAFLAGHGAALSPQDIDGDTPLHWAALEGRRDAIDWLLDRGVPIDAVNHRHEAPLLYAVKGLHYDAVEHLIGHGADIEVRNEYDRTPLLWTVREGGDLRMARMLLGLGADVNALDKFGTPSLNLAAWRGFGTLVDLLLDHGAQVTVEGHQGQMLVAMSIARGLTRLYQKLVAAALRRRAPAAQGGCASARPRRRSRRPHPLGLLSAQSGP